MEILLFERASEFSHSLGHQEPPTLATAATGLAPIADASEAWRRSTCGRGPPRRRVLPRNRPPRLTGVAPAPGHKPPPAPQKKIGRLAHARRATCRPGSRHLPARARHCHPHRPALIIMNQLNKAAEIRAARPNRKEPRAFMDERQF